MTPGARIAAAIEILDHFLDGAPVDKVLSNWARANRYAGSKDRAAVRDIVFDCLRNLRNFQHTGGQSGGRGLAIGYCRKHGLDLGELFSGAGYCPAVLSPDEAGAIDAVGDADAAVVADVPDWVLPLMQDALGDGFASAIDAMSDRAPVDLRVNIAKSTVSKAQSLLQGDGIITQAVEGVPTALRVLDNPRKVAGSKAYLEGYVELQDAASQSVVDQLTISAGLSVLDYCAGGGGKTLAIAAKHPNAKVSAWDIDPRRLEPLVERAKRANAKVSVLASIKDGATFDLVLVDAPCSGSGAWRRNPEGKWRLQEGEFDTLLQTQQDVVSKAATHVKAGGTLAYVTCSMLVPENQAQVDQFLAAHPAFKLISVKLFEVSMPGDGFFCAVMQKQL